MKTMHTDRRSFLRSLGIAGTAILAGIPAIALRDAGLGKLTILHTNDTHSRIDPYPGNDPNYPGMGGYARRATIINEARKKDPDLILLDAGDIFQGTPYFNFYVGEPELRLMTKMGYDASAFGNHEFDNGMDGFLEVLPNAGFPFLAANYDFSDTVLAGRVGKNVTFIKNGYKIGVYGLGINPKGLVSRNLYGDTVYHDPVEVAREQEKELKSLGCDLVICLSHLGLRYREEDRASDEVTARNTYDTDIIIGGHTHDRLKTPERIANMKNREVVIGQAGYGGTYIGYMEVLFNGDREINLVEGYTTIF